MAEGLNGAVAQLGERLVCNQEATGSIPVSSTRRSCAKWIPSVAAIVCRRDLKESMPIEVRVAFGGVSLFCFVVSLFGNRVDFRWTNWRFKPVVPNWKGRVYFAAFGLVFGVVAAFAK